DLFVMPSRTETFGLVYAEAISQGLPVLYTRGQGFDGQFTEGVVGYAVDADNPGEIAERIADAAEHLAELSGNGLRLAERFCWREICERYRDLYEEIQAREDAQST
ncbi:MAG: glycosyltransferase family 4 protein, partial [Muribaculum sp.]|nr:glycosyltransferase family 4 protein [Muribaculum sp.]